MRTAYGPALSAVPLPFKGKRGSRAKGRQSCFVSIGMKSLEANLPSKVEHLLQRLSALHVATTTDERYPVVLWYRVALKHDITLRLVSDLMQAHGLHSSGPFYGIGRECQATGAGGKAKLTSKRDVVRELEHAGNPLLLLHAIYGDASKALTSDALASTWSSVDPLSIPDEWRDDGFTAQQWDRIRRAWPIFPAVHRWILDYFYGGAEHKILVRWTRAFFTPSVPQAKATPGKRSNGVGGSLDRTSESDCWRAARAVNLDLV